MKSIQMRNLMKYEPYKILLGLIPIIMILSVLGFNIPVDIQMHDSYFVIDSSQIGFLFSILLGIFGILYWLMRKKEMINWMTVFHVLITILFVLTIMIYSLLIGNSPVRNNSTFKILNSLILGGVLIFIIGQMTFLMNLGVSIIKNRERNI